MRWLDMAKSECESMLNRIFDSCMPEDPKDASELLIDACLCTYAVWCLDQSEKFDPSKAELQGTTFEDVYEMCVVSVFYEDMATLAFSLIGDNEK